MSAPEPYEIFAIRWAESPFRLRVHNCLFCHPGDDISAPQPMDFYVWVVRNKTRTIVVDTGSKEWKCVQRGHEFIRSPVAGIEAIGVDPAKVDDVIVTHLHWDHAGNIEMFPNAQVHIQRKEVEFTTGPAMTESSVSSFYLVDDVKTTIDRLFEGAVTFHEKVTEIAPGVTLHEVGGHAAGMQIVRVYTARGWVVLAADASHYYFNMEEKNPFPALYNFPDTIKGYETCYALADSPDHVVPGHDPIVLKKYPKASSSLEGDVVRLDLDPIA
ncbi:hypothetical protein GCM10007276_30610 [Agaricicola taiwanensis]|uniref:Metallo-beta-lactamase domain-containing protein n=1 Tax=Agaricicola taiwanensis TaxID=591372 RepID=A0A8J2YLA6_9RHOB|nr:N-acyl homoserine lactonase family protein [Agaricicola taiwanensis]GGE51402.1 hypothetical protein GCM10007276_30610 [Agaricicola taiwanensis]